MEYPMSAKIADPLLLHPGRMPKDTFIGTAMISEVFTFNGRGSEDNGDEDDYDHLWETAVKQTGMGPILWDGEGDQSGYLIRAFEDWEPAGTVALYSPEGEPCGFYTNAMAWVDEGHRGRGLSAPLIAASAKLLGGSPTHNEDGVVGFTEAGHRAHERAWDMLRREYQDLCAKRAADPTQFHPGRMSLEEFIGHCSEVGEEYTFDGRDEAWEDHVWDCVELDQPVLWYGEGDQAGYRILALEGEADDGVVLISPDGEPCGFYCNGPSWIDPEHRGLGLSTPLILTEAYRVGRSPMAHAEWRDFSPAGYQAHVKAWEAARRECGLEIEVSNAPAIQRG
jgi:GNAT superfamily N-acetyltransferase